MAELLCTTRFDRGLETCTWNDGPDGAPSPYLLLHHQLDRLVASARRCRWTADALSYAALKHVCDRAVHSASGAGGNTPLKIRVTFSPSGNLTASASPVEPLRYDPTAASRFTPGVDTCVGSIPILSICVDTQPSSGTVSMKTTNRKVYDDARARAGIPPLTPSHLHALAPHHPDDVILFNVSGDIIESSTSNVAFYRHGRWLTPPLAVDCIPGVFRRWLLENGRIHEANQHLLSLHTIENNEWVLVFNGVAGCRLGRVYCDKR